MTKEQKNALNHLKRLVGCQIYPEDVNAMVVAIQAIEDLNKITKEITSAEVKHDKRT